MLEDVMPPEEQEAIVRRAIILDLIRLASAPGGDPHNRALAFYIRCGIDDGISEDEIKGVIEQARRMIA